MAVLEAPGLLFNLPGVSGVALVTPAMRGGWGGTDVPLALAPSHADPLITVVLLSQKALLQHSATALCLASAH